MKALLICSSGNFENASVQQAQKLGAKTSADTRAGIEVEVAIIGQGHLFRCQSFAAHLLELGWQVSLLELRFRLETAKFSEIAKLDSSSEASSNSQSSLNSQNSAIKHLCQNVANVAAIESAALPIVEQLFAENRWDLLLIDSYHFPPSFYRHCAAYAVQSDSDKRHQKSCRLLAQCDSPSVPDHLEGYYVIQACCSEVGEAEQADRTKQASQIEEAQNERYLRGLDYQVLRPEFASDCKPAENKLSPAFSRDLAQGPFRALLIPGSGLSLEQLELVLTALRHKLGQLVGAGAGEQQPLAVLLSERHSVELDARHSPGLLRLQAGQGIYCFRGLDAAELRQLYCSASIIFCAASQSLLELLSCLSQASAPASKQSQSQSQVFALLTADNQVAMLEQIQKILREQAPNSPSSPSSQAAAFSSMDLRGLHDAELEKICSQAFASLAEAEHIPQTMSCQELLHSSPTFKRLSDGKAVYRILQRLGLVSA